MRILFADKFQPVQLEELRALGHDCVFEPGLGADDLKGALVGCEALVVRSTMVDDSTIKNADSLRLIVRAGSGTNTIDKAAAAAHGIYVCNVPGKNAIAVAELTIGLMVAIDRNIPDQVGDLRAGRWDKKRYQQAAGLYGRSLGIMGLGDVGMAVAHRARAFGLVLHGIGRSRRSPELEAEIEALGFELHPDLESLAAACDILTFHVPATESTRNLLNRDVLSHLRPGSVVINTSRGDIVDEPALLEALEARDLRAGLDVYADEPPSGTSEWTSALAQHPRVYGTHHIGASTEQAQQAIASEVVRIFQEYENGRVLHPVNADAIAAARLPSVEPKEQT